MFRPIARSHRRPPRRGTSFILIVVVMLTLFSAVGTAYALYAMREARLSLARKDEAGGGTTTEVRAPDPTDTINRFFSSLIYGVGDGNSDPNDLLNSLRGNSLAESMYGRDGLTPFNTAAWAGVGIFQEMNTQGQRAQQVNYTLVMIGGQPFLLDPQYMGQRAVAAGAPVPAFDPTTRTYVSKAAPYSYPDLKDFFAAAVDPATGEVLRQSFYRPEIFGPLDPSNPNWTSATGRLAILRPRPAEHPQFPRVPPDADGQYRGDVQNWPGGFRYDTASGRFYSQNDSLWVDLGLPVITLPGNRKVKPLVAPLIVSLDGLFNASAHGNIYNGGNHISYAGYGPWEVNPGYALTAAGEASAVVAGRGANPQLRNGTTTRNYNPYGVGPGPAFTPIPLPSYAPVAWNASAVSLTYPQAPNSLQGLPLFNGFQSTNIAEASHPSLFNPSEWPGTAGLNFRTFPLGDNKRFSRYAFPPDWYSQADSAAFAPNGLRGTFGFSFNTGQATPANYNYRNDPAHYTRGLFGTRSFDLDRPRLVPSFTSGTLQLAPGTTKPTWSPGTYPFPQATGPGSDFTSSTQWVNRYSALGSVDLNRPLADYRNDTTAALSAGNVGNAIIADNDRKKLAHDIFVRLAAATGGALDINLTAVEYPTYQYAVSASAAPGTPQYNALRYLAQVAVNAVDYIDNDDVSTAFAWDPAAPTAFVFGVEKPRLVINEAYSEIVNDPMDPVVGVDMDGDMLPDPPTRPAQVRVWAELLNPTPTMNPATGPLGDGSVPLSAYQIQIRREARTTGVAAANRDAAAGNQAAYLFTDQSNTAGSFDTSTTGAPDATFALSGAAVTTVAPNNGQYSPPAASLPVNGIVLVGPPAAAKANSDEFAPTGGVWANMIQSPALQPATTAAGGMGYTFTLPASNATFSDAEFKRHIVLLRRLANPYQPFDAVNNPYVTVDLMDYVPAFDAVHRGQNDGNNRNPYDMTTNPGGYDPVSDAVPANNRFAVGKVQPYAGHAFATVTPGAPGAVRYNTYAFTNANPALASMVLDQTPTNPVAGQPKHTFGRHNGNGPTQPGGTTVVAGTPPSLNDKIMLPFDWLVHMDRPLVNQSELFQARDSAPHRVTDQFVQTNATGLDYELGYGRWRFTSDGLARALEYLTVKSYTAGVPHGGRVPGKINVNAMPDRRILQGLFDPQAGNGFDINFVNNTAWSQWMNSRNGVTQRPVADGVTMVDTVAAPGQSVYDSTTGTNRPFLAGAPAAIAGSTFAFGTGGNSDHTILRRTDTTNPLSLPQLYTTTSTASYLQAEPLRKILNNTTTVSHNYIVFLTIGYFDVVNVSPAPPAGWPTNVPVPPELGAEAYLEVPGDMRQKVVGIVDMSNMALEAATNAPATVIPFFTSLEQTARAGATTITIVTDASGNAVAADGTPVTISNTAPNNQLVIGYGSEQQVVTVVNVLGSGQFQVSPLSRTAWGGSCVSNVRPGYPGPQPAFDYTSPTYKPVLPYLERLR